MSINHTHATATDATLSLYQDQGGSGGGSFGELSTFLKAKPGIFAPNPLIRMTQQQNVPYRSMIANGDATDNRSAHLRTKTSALAKNASGSPTLRERLGQSAPTATTTNPHSRGTEPARR
jgi:hypothetical protein